MDRNCEQCGITFRLSHPKRGAKFCSIRCCHVAHQMPSSVNRRRKTNIDKDRASKKRRYHNDPKIKELSYLHKLAQKANASSEQCTVCGASPAERHHDDYNKPLEVRWLCRRCHSAYHKVERRAKALASIAFNRPDLSLPVVVRKLQGRIYYPASIVRKLQDDSFEATWSQYKEKPCRTFNYCGLSADNYVVLNFKEYMVLHKPHQWGKSKG